ncbi:hypothetical protein [Paludisphaera mucosa]|uniref:Uncharacterized protein n=1 Tax=Paludisphaera mucosa TaxID=3030827 RepID=A0ABT6FLQ6_9BACT|nr:hypothetical protein [Paludisphaera mucosa]MDG3008517.1 hypothetical protein [Paludisphaera mucosa]
MVSRLVGSLTTAGGVVLLGVEVRIDWDSGDRRADFVADRAFEAGDVVVLSAANGTFKLRIVRREKGPDGRYVARVVFNDGRPR